MSYMIGYWNLHDCLLLSEKSSHLHLPYTFYRAPQLLETSEYSNWASFFTHVFVFEDLNSWNSRLDPDFCPGLVLICLNSRLIHNCKHTTYLIEGFFKLLERYDLSFSQSYLFPDIFFARKCCLSNGQIKTKRLHVAGYKPKKYNATYDINSTLRLRSLE